MYLKFCNLTLDNFRKLRNQNVLLIYIIESVYSNSGIEKLFRGMQFLS